MAAGGECLLSLLYALYVPCWSVSLRERSGRFHTLLLAALVASLPNHAVGTVLPWSFSGAYGRKGLRTPGTAALHALIHAAPTTQLAYKP